MQLKQIYQFMNRDICGK